MGALWPIRDGWSVMADLRRHGVSTPVLFLTARDAVNDRVKGLELGADDYVVKPFAFSELLARVRSLLRRGAVRQPTVSSVADLEIDLMRHRATRGGRLLELTPKEFLLLSLLMRRAGDVLSRTLIAEQVWDMIIVHGHSSVFTASCDARSSIRSRFISRVNSSQNSAKSTGSIRCSRSAVSTRASRRSRRMFTRFEQVPLLRAAAQPTRSLEIMA